MVYAITALIVCKYVEKESLSPEMKGLIVDLYESEWDSAIDTLKKFYSLDGQINVDANNMAYELRACLRKMQWLLHNDNRNISLNKSFNVRFVHNNLQILCKKTVANATVFFLSEQK